MPNMFFDNIARSNKIIKNSFSSMLPNKDGNKVVFNELDNDFLHLSSRILLGTLRTKAPPLFCRATMAKTIIAPYNKFNNIILKFFILPFNPESSLMISSSKLPQNTPS
jgi:hypothetical protein